jgi:hypothetical protein
MQALQYAAALAQWRDKIGGRVLSTLKTLSIDIEEGALVTVDERSIGEAKLAESQKAAVEAFVAGIEAINEELPPEFDGEIARGLKLREVDFS